MHLVSVDDLDTEMIQRVLKRTQEFKARRKTHLFHDWPFNSLQGKLLISDFFEPSTRTRLSFEAAMTYLGGNVIGTENAAEFSSIKKGESIADNFKVISGYCDVIVGRFRHEGEARIAADASLVPLINGGDGIAEHPTQALIDYFTMWDHFRSGPPLRVTFVGDNKRSRTVRSLVRLLTKFDIVTVSQINFVSHPDLGPSAELQELPNTAGMTSDNFYDLDTETLEHSDVIYVTRSQNERSGLHSRTFELTPNLVDKMPPNAIVMHPLPRNSEISVEVDANPRAKYFEQAHNGLYLRMALLEALCS